MLKMNDLSLYILEYSKNNNSCIVSIILGIEWEFTYIVTGHSYTNIQYMFSIFLYGEYTLESSLPSTFVPVYFIKSIFRFVFLFFLNFRFVCKWRIVYDENAGFTIKLMNLLSCFQNGECQWHSNLQIYSSE